MGTTIEQVAIAVNLPQEHLQNPSQLKSILVQQRLSAVNHLLSRVRPWFYSDQEVWEWFINRPITSFGNLTPSAVLRLSGADGLFALQDYIKNKEQGGFE